ncbi:hypothetical protein RHGRI_023647 [Rhododendron griersonianum]|uniref:Uncharacterized protein n=1 Tax=Rhododendron griersonianum TaxID=479676 RepID=A0AAV6J9S2_9ERIC|nr:hypothetical protein RHGRI_023647 [Rhododendron griersonianum]
MPPGQKVGRRSGMPSPPQSSPSVTVEPSLSEDVLPRNSDALGDNTSLEQSRGAGRPLSNRVRGKTLGKGVDKLVAQNGGNKLPVPVLEQWNTLCGVNAPKASMLLGVYIRRMAPIKNTLTWWDISEAIQSAIIQAVLDKIKISDDYRNNQVAQKAVHAKCYRIHLNWRYNMKLHYRQLLKDGEDTYSSPYENMAPEDWRHLIDDVWATDKHKPEDNGYANLEFPEFYEKMHTKKDNTWIDDICATNHSKMLSQREESSQSGVQWTPEGMSGDVLRKRKRYILGFGVGPKPTSSSSKTDIASQARDEELQNYRANMEKIEMEREEEKREREQERREREQERREREEEKRQREEERREYEAGQKKMADRLLLLEEKTQAHSSPTHRGRHFITSTSTGREIEKQRRQQEAVQKNKEDLLRIWQENSKALGPRIDHGGHISSTSTGGRRAHWKVFSHLFHFYWL